MGIKLRYFIIGFLFGCCFPIGAYTLEIHHEALTLSWETLITIHQKNILLYMIDSAPIFLGLFALIGGVSKAKSEMLIKRFIHVSDILANSNGKVQGNTNEILESLNKAISCVRSDYSDLFEVYAKSNTGIGSAIQTAHGIGEQIEQMKEMLEKLFKSQKDIDAHNFEIKNYLEKYAHQFNSLLSHLDFLDDFCLQIELLGVNSSIEASHFGEQGKVFQVFSKTIQHLVKGIKERNSLIGKKIATLSDETLKLFKVIEDESMTVKEMTNLNRGIIEISVNFENLSQQFISRLEAIISQLKDQDQHSTSFERAIDEMTIASKDMLSELQNLISGQSGIIQQMKRVG